MSTVAALSMAIAVPLIVSCLAGGAEIGVPVEVTVRS